MEVLMVTMMLLISTPFHIPTWRLLSFDQYVATALAEHNCLLHRTQV